MRWKHGLAVIIQLNTHTLWILDNQICVHDAVKDRGGVRAGVSKVTE